MSLRLALLLFASLLLAACSLFRPPRIDPSLAALVPPDTLALADVRLDQLRATPLYHKFEEKNLLPGPREFRAEIDELLLASDGRHDLAIARGRFAGQLPGFTLLNNQIAVAGAPRERFHGGAPAPLLARLEALPGPGQVWAVSSGWPGFPESAAREMGNAANLNRVLQSVETAAFTADLRAGLHLTAEGDCRTAQAAQSLAESLRGLLGVARLGLRPSQPDLLRAFDAIQVRPAGRSILVTIDLPLSLAGPLMDEIAAR
jgi:hypothetical protein